MNTLVDLENKTITITKALLTPKEMLESNSDTYWKAYNRWAEYNPAGWSDEIVESLKAICKAAGVTIKDYELGGWDRHTWRITMPEPNMWDADPGCVDYDAIENLSGPRALTWIENNILSPLRIPWRGTKRWELAKYGKYYRPGMVKPCPWTGYCADEDFIESLISDINSGETLGEAFVNLGRLAHNMIQAEYSDEVFDEEPLMIAEDGSLVYI
jgi:hypothetical protein